MNNYLCSSIFHWTRAAAETTPNRGGSKRQTDELSDLAYVLQWCNVLHAHVLEKMSDCQHIEFREHTMIFEPWKGRSLALSPYVAWYSRHVQGFHQYGPGRR